jgi:hypothetical protein
MSSLADEIRTELRNRAEGLDRRASAAVDATGVYIEAEAAARQAARLLIRAACAGLLGVPRAIIARVVAATQPIRSLGASELATIRRASALIATDEAAALAILSEAKLVPGHPEPGDNFVFMLLRAERFAELNREPTPDELGACRPLSDEAMAKLANVVMRVVTHDGATIRSDLLDLWGSVICPYLRAARPGDFCPDGEYDFPKLPDQERRRLIDQKRETGTFDWRAAAASRVAHPALGPVGEYSSSAALTHARAQARVWAEAMRSAVNLIGEMREEIESGQPTFTAAADYSWVSWPSGRVFTFTRSMRPVVRRLCEDARRGLPGTAKNDLLDTTSRDKATSVRDLFKKKGGKMADAWRVMIIRVEGSQDIYTIRGPGSAARGKGNQRSPRKSPN